MSGHSHVEAIEGFDVVRVRADNPGPLTLDGTNTWVLGRGPAWVVDPGPDLGAHLDAVAEVVADRGGAGGIVLTHGHGDHADGVEGLRARLGGIDVRTGPGPAGPLDGVPVPGHTDDHVCFAWEEVVCTGDAVLGAGSVFVAGDMAGYLDGLRALHARSPRLLCPGHGPPVLDAAARLEAYVAHRLDRERRLAEALDAGVRGEDALLDAVWDDAPVALREPARWTMRAHLRKLAAERRLPDDVAVPAAPGELPAV